uniref:Uncharacterized protein n=1 Tax=Arundo donax TaxID=35708 RepID=A0A0A9EF91_ARUDO
MHQLAVKRGGKHPVPITRCHKSRNKLTSCHNQTPIHTKTQRKSPF